MRHGHGLRKLNRTSSHRLAMFRNMGGDSAAIGQALAIALLGTLYGCLICNVVCGPIADKLSIRSAHEQFIREMMLVGILGLQSGDKAMVWGLLSQPTRGERTRGAKEALEQAGLKFADVDYWEINEAFAVVTMIAALPAGVWLQNRALQKTVFGAAIINRLFYLPLILMPS